MPLAAIGHSLETALWIFTRYINHFARLSIQKKSIGSHSRQKKRGIYKFLQLELREDTSDRDSVK
jgi:hypothetical protein